MRARPERPHYAVPAACAWPDRYLARREAPVTPRLALRNRRAVGDVRRILRQEIPDARHVAVPHIVLLEGRLVVRSDVVGAAVLIDLLERAVFEHPRDGLVHLFYHCSRVRVIRINSDSVVPWGAVGPDA